MKKNIKNVFLLVFFMSGFLLTFGVQRVSAACNPACTAPMICSANNECIDATHFVNPLTYTSVEGLLDGILGAIQKIIVVLALVFIMIGAVMILTSAGSSGMVEQGKKAITMALIGLALGVAAPSLLKELSVIIGWAPGQGGDALTLSQIAMNVLNFLLGMMGILALVMLVIGGIMYLTSAGDEDRIEKGKEIFKYSLIGLILAMASMILVTQVAKLFVSSSTTSSTGTSSTTRRSMPTVPVAADIPLINVDPLACQNAGGDSSEACIIMDNDPGRTGQYLMPVGMSCTWRSVCPNDPMQGCCKPE